MAWASTSMTKRSGRPAPSAHGWARFRTVGYHMPTPRQLPQASLAVSQRHTQNPNNSRFADPPGVRFNRVQGVIIAEATPCCRVRVFAEAIWSDALIVCQQQGPRRTEQPARAQHGYRPHALRRGIRCRHGTRVLVAIAEIYPLAL